MANRRTNNLSHESYYSNDTLDGGVETSPTSKMLRQEGSLPIGWTHTHTSDLRLAHRRSDDSEQLC